MAFILDRIATIESKYLKLVILVCVIEQNRMYWILQWIMQIMQCESKHKSIMTDILNTLHSNHCE